MFIKLNKQNIFWKAVSLGMYYDVHYFTVQIQIAESFLEIKPTY